MAAGLLGVSPVMAQDSTRLQPPVTWDLATCLAYAQSHNITINSLRLSAKSGEQDVMLSRAARYPNLGGNVSQSLTNYTSGGSLNPASGYGISSTVTLYNGGYINNDIKQKDLTLKAANLDVQASGNDITLQITQAYLNILLARENIVYLQDLIATTQAQVTQGQQRMDAGTLARKDLLELQAVLANDKYTLVAAQNTERQNTLTLKQILQLPTDTGFTVSPAPADTTQKGILAAPLAQAQQTALDNRPEVKSGALGVQIAEINIEKARAGLRPVLSLGGSLYTGYTKDPAYKYFPQLNNNFYQQLGLTLSIPIFDRKVTRTNVEKARIQTDQAKLNLQNTKLVLTQAIEQAYLNVQNAQSQYSAAKEQLNYTEEAYRIANEQLKIGVYNTVEYLQQKNLYIQALQSYIQAKYASELYTRIYNFYTGIPVTQ